MKKLIVFVLITFLSVPAFAKPNSKKQKKLNAYVKILNLTGRSYSQTVEEFGRWVKRGQLEKCESKHIRWPTGLVSQFNRLKPDLAKAIKMKGKTKADKLAKIWLASTDTLIATDKKAAKYFKAGLYKEDKCAKAKIIAGEFDKNLMGFGQALGNISNFYAKKELEQMRKGVKKIKKKHGNGFWYAQANLLLQAKVLLGVFDQAASGDVAANKELLKSYKGFSKDLKKLNKKRKKKKAIVGTHSSYTSWAKNTNEFSDVIASFIKMQDIEAFSKLKKWEKSKLQKHGNMKKLIQKYNNMVNKANAIQYSKDFQ